MIFHAFLIEFVWLWLDVPGSVKFLAVILLSDAEPCAYIQAAYTTQEVETTKTAAENTSMIHEIIFTP